MNSPVRSHETLVNAASGASRGGQQLEDEMLANLEPATRESVVRCHGMYRHMYKLDRPLTLLTWITVWINQCGLLEEDARAMLDGATSFVPMSENTKPELLQAWLAKSAMDSVNRRQQVAEAAARRLPDISPDEQEKARAKLAEARAGVFRSV